MKKMPLSGRSLENPMLDCLMKHRVRNMQLKAFERMTSRSNRNSICNLLSQSSSRFKIWVFQRSLHKKSMSTFEVAIYSCETFAQKFNPNSSFCSWCIIYRLLGWELWFSGYGRRLMYERSWVQIPATKWIIFHILL